MLSLMNVNNILEKCIILAVPKKKKADKIYFLYNIPIYKKNIHILYVF